MPKFYIESGELQGVVDANNPTQACVKVIKKKMFDENSEHINLGEVFSINQKGFLSQREPFIVDTFNDLFINTTTVFEALEGETE